MNQPRHWHGCSTQRLKKKENQRRRAHKRFRPVFWRVEELNENCPSRWLSALILRRLSKAAIGGKQNGRHRKIGGATQQLVSAGDCWIGEATRGKMGCERRCAGRSCG